MDSIESAVLENWLPRLHRLFGITPNDFIEQRKQFSEELQTAISARDTVWQILCNLDSGILSLRERVNVYSSLAMFLYEEARDHRPLLKKAKELILSGGGEFFSFGVDRFYLLPVEDIPVGETLPIVLIGEFRRGFHYQDYQIVFTLQPEGGEDISESFGAVPNPCGVITAFWELRPEAFPVQSHMCLYMSSKSMGIHRTLVAEFELLPRDN
jgi:hypothetical protein